MAELTLEDCMRKLRGFPQAIAQEGELIMKQEVPVGRTRQLKESVTGSASGDSVTVIADTPYAQYVQNGRGPVVPFNKRFLKWEEYNGSQTSIHHGGSGTVFAKYADSTQPNDFEGRTKRRLQSRIDAIWAFL